MKGILYIIIAVIVIAGGFLLLRNRSANTIDTSNNASTTTPAVTEKGSGGGTNQYANDIIVSFPKAGDKIVSPLQVSGKARGSWYFEASAPVKVVDGAGKVLGTGHIQAQGEWMTTDFVPFSGKIEFSTSTQATSTAGFVIFENDNPSGDPSLSKSVSIPVNFK